MALVWLADSSFVIISGIDQTWIKVECFVYRKSYVADACISLVEREVPSGALVQVDNIKGIKMVLPEEAPYVDLPWLLDQLL